MNADTTDKKVRPVSAYGSQFTDYALVQDVIKNNPGMPQEWYVKYLTSRYGLPHNDARILVRDSLEG